MFTYERLSIGGRRKPDATRFLVFRIPGVGVGAQAAVQSSVAVAFKFKRDLTDIHTPPETDHTICS